MSRLDAPLPEFEYTPELHQALREFVGVWRDGFLADDIGTKLNCTEAEVLAGVFIAAGFPDQAETLIECHAEGDDGGDMHYRGAEDTPEDTPDDTPQDTPEGGDAPDAAPAP